MAVTRETLGLLLAAALAGCTRPPPPSALGRRLVDGEALVLRGSADGGWIAFLHRCAPERDRTLPAGTASCELAVVPSGGGTAKRVAGGVSTFGPGFAWSRSGHVLAALAEHDHAAGRGALVVWSGGEARRVAADVAFFALDREGARVGWIAAGQLFLAPVEGPGDAVAGAQGVATFEFGGHRGLELLARRSSRAGGALLAIRGRAASEVARDVRDYGFSADGARFAYTAGVRQALAVAPADRPAAAPPLGRDVQSFLFSPRGDAIAFVADAAPGRQGDLWVAPLGGGVPERLAQRVGEPRWAEDGSRIAWLQDYDPRSRTGTLAVGGPGRKPHTLAQRVSDFDLAAGGPAVAYLVHETAGGYSVDLGLSPDGAAVGSVARGVFGFAFSPDGRWLYYRTGCVREAEACQLERVPATGPAGPPERIADGVKSFEFAPGRPERLLLTWARKDRVALDLALWDAGRLEAVDTLALPGSAHFLGGDARRLAYVVVDPKRRGVYVADLP